MKMKTGEQKGTEGLFTMSAFRNVFNNSLSMNLSNCNIGSIQIKVMPYKRSSTVFFWAPAVITVVLP